MQTLRCDGGPVPRITHTNRTRPYTWSGVGPPTQRCLHVPKYIFNWQSFQTMEERHIVVGDEIPDDVRIAESGDDSNGN